jgi:hypothetical protein
MPSILSEPLGRLEISIARSVGLGSTARLTRLLKQYANETSRGVREPGGFGWVLRCFERFLAKAVVRRAP